MWKKYPALFVGIALLCGCALAIDFNWAFFIPPASMFFLRKRWFLLFATIVGFGMTQARYHPPEKMSGEGHFVVTKLQKKASPFSSAWQISGRFKQFEGTGKNIPCSINLPLKTPLPQCDRDYLLEGTLIPRGKHAFLFKLKKGSAWKEIPNTFCLAQWRFQVKEGVRCYLKRRLKQEGSFALLSALATGDVEDREMGFAFGQVGLQHVLAISGFHFGWIVLMLSLLLQLFFSPRQTALLLLPLMTAYFLFIGDSPSCQRAWIAISAFLIGRICNLRTSGLNILGVALIIALAMDPLSALHLGFQLSFLMTLAILLFYPLFEKWLEHLLPRRPFSTLLEMNSLHQHGYIFACLLRKTFSLNGAVHLMAIPTLLFLFNKFPLLSIAYNLFIPFWVAIALILLITGCLFPPLLYISDHYTAFLVKVTSHPPLLFHFFLRIPTIPLWGFILFLTFLFWSGMRAKSKLTESPF